MLVSAAILPNGTCGELLRIVREVQVAELLVCPRFLTELTGVTERPKFRRWISLSEAARYVEDLAEVGQACEDPGHVQPARRDPNDDYLVAFAQAEAADALVSGDRDLLDIPDPPIAVLSPRAALDMLLKATTGEQRTT